MVARFHKPDESNSAVATLKCARNRSFMLRTTCRLSLRDCACSMRSSRVRNAIIPSSVVGRSSLAKSLRVRFWRTTNDERPTTDLNHYFCRDFLCHKRFNHVANFYVPVVGNRDATFHAIGDLAGIILEAAQRSDLAFKHDHVVSQQADFGIALDQTIGDTASGNSAIFRNAEGVQLHGAALQSFIY